MTADEQILPARRDGRHSMTQAPELVVCFAVKEEARYFDPAAVSGRKTGVLLTGMGRRNAEKAIAQLLREGTRSLVLSCGFAGALRPGLTRGTILFTSEGQTGLEKALLSAGAQPGRFYCADKVATTAEQKRELWQMTGADAVEMESEVICQVCRGRSIPHATVRVILDEAEEDLPLDFNKLLTADQRLSYRKLLLALLKSPAKVKRLLVLQKHSADAARKLAAVVQIALNSL
jgi:adenosylhomocysteine nucleosidase